MTALAARIAAAVRQGGPISVERFWNIALFDRQDGYYMTAEPFGAQGDFTTAPEISQIFGELIGAWLVAAWRELGRPSSFVLAEFGPGRGTLMADILRTARKLDAAFMRAAKVRLIETSDRLAAEQKIALSRFDLPIRHVKRFAEIEAEPLFLVANELFDAVAIRQYVFDGADWRERLVGLGENGSLAFAPGPPCEPAHIPASAPAAGDIFEISPLREGLAAGIGSAIAERSGAALIVDYGHTRSGYGDTLQALRAHRFSDALDDPGRQDITSHVDFERIAQALGAGGAVVSPVVEQGDLLFQLGLAERAGALAQNADEAQRAAIEAAARRLAGGGRGEMGRLFKAVAVASLPLMLPPFRPAEASD